jgi:hypothetical protein
MPKEITQSVPAPMYPAKAGPKKGPIKKVLALYGLDMVRSSCVE